MLPMPSDPEIVGLITRSSTNIRPSEYHCSECDYSSPRQYNLLRHIEKRHGETEPKKTQKEILADSRKKFAIENPQPSLTCEKCNHEFARHKNLLDHKEICRGVPVNTCKICLKICSNSRVRWNHESACTGPKINAQAQVHEDASALMVIPKPDKPSDDKKSTIIQNIQNIQNNNIVINQTINQNVINVVPFPTDQLVDEPVFMIPRDRMNDFLSNMRSAVQTSDFKLIETALKEILAVPENRVIRKADLKSAYTKVHMGDGVWQEMCDAQVYPRVLYYASKDSYDMIEGAPTHRYFPKERAKDALSEFCGNVQNWIDDEPEDGLTESEIVTKKHMKRLTWMTKISANEEHRRHSNRAITQ